MNTEPVEETHIVEEVAEIGKVAREANKQLQEALKTTLDRVECYKVEVYDYNKCNDLNVVTVDYDHNDCRIIVTVEGEPRRTGGDEVFIDPENVKVIGNIYENPELLEGQG